MAARTDAVVIIEQKCIIVLWMAVTQMEHVLWVFTNFQKNSTLFGRTWLEEETTLSPKNVNEFVIYIFQVKILLEIQFETG